VAAASASAKPDRVGEAAPVIGPRFSEWRVEAADQGERLDAVLARRHPDQSRSQLQSLIKGGKVSVDGRAVKPSHTLRAGETVRLELPPPPRPETIAPTALTFPILHEDDDLIVIDKPTGLVVHPGAAREAESVVSALLGHTTLSPVGAPLRPGIVHRLDKTTSGVLVAAKTEAAHKRLAKAFAGRTVEKEYLAIVQGQLSEERGRIEVAIERDRVHRKRMTATHPDRGKMAISRFQVEERFAGATLVRIWIETGRTHQIRVHMAYLGHPLCGDVLYGGRSFLGRTHHYLHCARIALTHPTAKSRVEWQAPLPEAFNNALVELRTRAAPRPLGPRR